MMVGARFFASVLWLSACTHELEGAPCPCIDPDYQCCEGICLAKTAVCELPVGGSAAMNGVAGEGGAASSLGGPSSSAAGEDAEQAGAPDGGSSPKGSAGQSPLAGDAAFALISTEHNDNSRTGANRFETVLTVDGVKAHFGELSRRPVRGAVFAQPLVAPRVVIESQERDLLIVATMGNFVYALDANQPAATPVWVSELGPSILLPDPHIEQGAGEIWHEAGILSTPVLDPERGELYVVAATKRDETYAHTVYVLRLADGSVARSVKVAYAGFDSVERAQRSALTLADGVLYVPFGGYATGSLTTGWVFAYDTSLQLLGATELGRPDGGGVSMTGRGPVAVDGRLYLTVSRTSGIDYPSSYSKLIELSDTVNTLFERLVPPYGFNELGSAGPLFLAPLNGIFVAGQRHSYLVPQTSDTFNAFTQELEAGSSEPCPRGPDDCRTEAGTPVYLGGSESDDTARVFIWPASDVLRSFQLDEAAGKIACDAPSPHCTATAVAKASDSNDALQHPIPRPAHLSLSSNDGAPSTNIVWAAQPYRVDSYSAPDGILRAFDADDLSQLWNSEGEGAALGPLAPGALPTVSGGKVFVGIADGVSNKQAFWDDWSGGPLGITSFGDRYLVLAWGIASPGTQALHVTWSTDGYHFDSFNDLPGQPLTWEPALAADGHERIFLAFTDHANRIVAYSDVEPDFEERIPLTARAPGAEATPLAITATTSPALAFADGRLFMAWHDDDGLHLMSSPDGASFDTSTLVSFIGYTSYVAPVLQYSNGKLYLVTTSREHRLRIFVSSDGGAQFSEPTELSPRSPGHPALFSNNPQGSRSPDLLMMWVNADSDTATNGNLHVGTSTSDTTFELGRVHVLASDQAESSVTGTSFRDSFYFAWLGTNGAPHPNVARYSSGELVTYGLTGR